MFLYGMRLMGDGLKQSSSGTLKQVMERVTNNTFKAFLLGVAVTAIIQSSTATIVITSGLVGAGLLTLRQSLGIIIGANVGTTVTGQIIRLLDMDAGGSWLQIFQPSSLAPIALIIGIVMIMGMENRISNARQIGNIAIGFGILFSGLLNMTSAVSALSESPLIQDLFTGIGNNPLAGYASGTAVAFVLQSSSATIGILQAFSSSGLLIWHGIYPIIVGVYLGDCVTTAIVCSIGASPDSRRVGVINIAYNLIKSALVLIGVSIAHSFGLLDGLWNQVVNSSLIANTNTIFNIVCALLILPVIPLLEKLSYRLVKEEPVEVNKYQEKLDALSPVFFTSPALALGACYDLLKIQLQLSRKNIDLSYRLLTEYDEKVYEEIQTDEVNIDMFADRISGYLVSLLPHLKNEQQISILDEYYRAFPEFERLGDHAVNISDNAKSLADKNTSFSHKAISELNVLMTLLDRILDETEQAFAKRDIDAAYRIEPQVQVAGEIISQLKRNHLKRMSNGVCNVYADASFTNLMIELKRIADVCSNIGVAALVRVRPELADHEHLYFESLHQGGNEFFDTEYAKEYEKYFSQLNRVVQPGPVTASAPEEPKTVSGDDGTSGTGKKKTKKKPERAKEK